MHVKSLHVWNVNNNKEVTFLHYKMHFLNQICAQNNKLDRNESKARAHFRRPILKH